MTNIPWPETLVQRCVELWREGHGAQEIGKIIGKTKNAIIGRMTRMRVATGDQTLLRRLPVDPTIPKVPKVSRGKYKPRRKEPTYFLPMSVGETACRLEHLTLRTCRWPVGEATGEFQLFCGLPHAALEDNRPYCEGHSRIAYREGTNEHHHGFMVNAALDAQLSRRDR